MSLLKHEVLQPVRHFNMHDDPLTNIETLHLVIWDKGLCIAGYDPEGNVLTAKVYNYPSWDFQAIESVFINEPLVAGPQPVTHTWIADERSLVIPRHFYTPEAAEEWLRKFYFIETGERVASTEAGNTFSIGYPVQEKLDLLLEKYFSEGKTEALAGALLHQQTATDKDYADLVWLGDKAALTLYKQGVLQLHQVATSGAINDLVYKMASACSDHGLKPEELTVYLSGFCMTEDFQAELKSFFPKTVIPGSEQFSSFTLLSKLVACAL